MPFNLYFQVTIRSSPLPEPGGEVHLAQHARYRSLSQSEAENDIKLLNARFEVTILQNLLQTLSPKSGATFFLSIVSVQTYSYLIFCGHVLKFAKIKGFQEFQNQNMFQEILSNFHFLMSPPFQPLKCGSKLKLG